MFCHITSEREKQLNISEPPEFSRKSDPEHMTHQLHPAHTASSHPQHHRFQDSRQCNTKGSITHKPSDYSENESAQLETTTSSSLSDSHASTTLQCEQTGHYAEEISAVQPSSTPNIPFTHCSCEETASAKHGYSQGSHFTDEPQIFLSDLLAL